MSLAVLFFTLPTPHNGAHTLSLNQLACLFTSFVWILFNFCFSIRVRKYIYFAISSYFVYDVRYSIQSIDFNTSMSTRKCWTYRRLLAVLLSLLLILLLLLSFALFRLCVIRPSNNALQSKYIFFVLIIICKSIETLHPKSNVNYGISSTSYQFYLITACTHTLAHIRESVGLLVGWFEFELRYSHADPDTSYHFWVHHFCNILCVVCAPGSNDLQRRIMRVSTDGFRCFFLVFLWYLVYTCHL